MIFTLRLTIVLLSWAAVRDLLHFSYAFCPYGSVLTTSLCMESFSVFSTKLNENKLTFLSGFMKCAVRKVFKIYCISPLKIKESGF